MANLIVDYDITPFSRGAAKLSIKTTGVDMPSAVFAIEVLPKSRDPRNVNYRFSHICSLSELIEFPAEEDPEMCYFRTDDIELIFDTITIALKTKEAIAADLDTLILMYNEFHDTEPEPPGPTPGPDPVPDVYYEDL